MKRFLLLLPIMLVVTGCASAFIPDFKLEPTLERFGERGPFIMPRSASDYPVWGLRGGIVLGIPPARIGLGRPNKGGPRGLLRVGFNDGGLFFINFLSINPMTTAGRTAGSELDRSPTDTRPGILTYAYPLAFHTHYDRWRERKAPDWTKVDSVITDEDGVREMSLVIRYETFPNKAKPYFVITFREDRPTEAFFEFFTEPDGEPLTRNVLSSTFGNLTRQRDLYLRQQVVNARELWPHYRARGFAPIKTFPLSHLRRNRRGDVVFAATPDEEKPWREEVGYPHHRVLTQYFRKPREDIDDSLKGLVNGRYMYWQTNIPVFGGISFENVALVEDYREGAVQVFGYHEGNPEALFQ